MRHGYESYNPLLPAAERVTNRAALAEEIGQVYAAVTLLMEARDLDPVAITAAMDRKVESVKCWMHHQGG